MPGLDFLVSIRDDFFNLLNRKSEVNADVFLNPGKYVVRLPVGRIVADSKVSRRGIEIYKEKIAQNKKFSPIIVVKHPQKDLYAVLDGHHRYYAYLAMGRKEIDCALAGDYSGVLFYLTEHGYFQPSPELTEGIRYPAIRLHRNLKQFLTNLLDGKI
jgi:hypothetical protein